jgi:hypothetical protein
LLANGSTAPLGERFCGNAQGVLGSPALRLRIVTENVLTSLIVWGIINGVYNFVKFNIDSPLFEAALSSV